MKNTLPLLFTAIATLPTFLPLNAGTVQVPAPVVVESEKSTARFIDPALLGFGAPGFSIATTGSGTMDYDESSRKSGSLDLFDVRVRAPLNGIKLGESAFGGVSLNYQYTYFDATRLLGLKQQTLHSADLQFFLARFPTTNQGWMGILLVNPGISSDFRNLSGDSFSLTAVAVVGYQFSDRLTLAVSGAYNHSIGEDVVVPGVGVIWRPTDTITLQLLPPLVSIGWTPLPEWTFSVTTYPGGGAWNVDRQGTAKNVDAINLELWRAGLGVERRFGDHWRVTAVAGANLGGKIELRDSSQRVLADRDLKPSAFGLLGLAWDF